MKNAICSDMDGTRDVIVNEVNQRQTAYDTVYMWNLKTKMYKWTYLENRNKSTDIDNKLIFTKREVGEG